MQNIIAGLYPVLCLNKITGIDRQNHQKGNH
ncbi:hypothetical protein DET0309 [Dehalococcoides mccartyi 195]|uniref:Uncharacterized protein n=1 Tax=Dehalococcoides mccartyi (strain ATCC BAA-2266 / KCTC 15142 / 195) TaxID=243164 RepID=Q3Z9P2_DEHM1|nr:hypothetical protein DET0309 [Dehalococcoides mccartyi 195]